MSSPTRNKVTLSIIIPHYNSPTTLRKMLESIPYNKAIETIVVDDKSDKCLEAFRNCKECFPEVRFVNNETDKKGAGVSRNIGIEQANGEWILFADADDVFLPDVFGVIFDNMKDMVDIVFFLPTSINQDGKIGKRHIEFANYVMKYANNKDRSNLNNLKYRFTPPWAKLIKRELIEKHSIKFGEQICAEDVMFSCKTAYYAKEIAVVSTPIYCIVENDNSMTSNADEAKNYFFSKTMIERYRFLKTKLSKEEIHDLDISSIGRIYLTLKSNMRVKTKIQHTIMLIKSGMPIIPHRILLPSFWKVRFEKNAKIGK